MSKCGIGEFDKTRQRNQFTRHERDHLLSIMSEFSEKLEDKNLSILARKEIWTTIDKKFRDGGFSDRTTAQLKKYWQNYKYHNGRNKWRKENAAIELEFFNKSSKGHNDSTLHIPQIFTDNYIDIANASQSIDNITQSFQDKLETPIDLIKRPAVIISETDISGSSVTVSVIHSKNGKRKKPFNVKNTLLQYDTNQKINNEEKLKPKKKLKGKCLLLQPRKLNKTESSLEMNDNNEKYFGLGKIDQSLPAKFLQSPKKIGVYTRDDEEMIRNDRQFVPLISPNAYLAQLNLQFNLENHADYQKNNFQYKNLHVIQQLQLLRYLEAEEHRLKVKLAEMSLKETHLKILHLKEECEGKQMKFTI